MRRHASASQRDSTTSWRDFCQSVARRTSPWRFSMVVLVHVATFLWVFKVLPWLAGVIHTWAITIVWRTATLGLKALEALAFHPTTSTGINTYNLNPPSLLMPTYLQDRSGFWRVWWSWTSRQLQRLWTWRSSMGQSLFSICSCFQSFHWIWRRVLWAT